jgi:hypothetical protein
MGVRARVADDQRPLGSSSRVVVTVDQHGNEIAREVVRDAPGRRADVLPFVVELDDGVAAELGG